MASVGRLSRAVGAAIRAAQPSAADTGAVVLARRYAALMDDAAPAAKYRDPLRKIRAAIDPGDQAAMDAYDKVVIALAEHSVASDLGPKLLAALTALGLTPAGRGAKGGAPRADAIARQLDEFTARRARKRNA